MPDDISTRQRFFLASNPPPDPNFEPMPLNKILDGPTPRRDITAQRTSARNQELRSGGPAGAATDSDPPRPQIGPISIGALEAAKIGAVQGAFFGFADELGAAAGTLDAIVLGDRRDLSSIYNEKLEILRDRARRAQRDNPIAFGAGMFGGAAAIVGGAATGGNSLIPKSASTGMSKKAQAAALEGAVAGGLAGIGAAEGGFDLDGLKTRFMSGAKGGFIGIHTGLISPKLAQVGTKAVKDTVRDIRSFIASNRQAKNILNAIANRLRPPAGSPQAKALSLVKSLGDEDVVTAATAGGLTGAVVQNETNRRPANDPDGNEPMDVFEGK